MSVWQTPHASSRPRARAPGPRAAGRAPRVLRRVPSRRQPSRAQPPRQAGSGRSPHRRRTGPGASSSPTRVVRFHMDVVVTIAEVRTFETRGGNTRYVVRDEDGNEYTTFREAI